MTTPERIKRCLRRKQLAKLLDEIKRLKAEVANLERDRNHWKIVAENAMQDHAQADTDSIRALHERNRLRDLLATIDTNQKP